MADDLTPDEERDVQGTEMDGEEAHRYGEFEDLRGMLENITSAIDGLSNRLDSVYDAVVMGPAIDAQNGDVEVADVDGDGDLDVIDMDPDIDGADLTLDDID